MKQVISMDRPLPGGTLTANIEGVGECVDPQLKSIQRELWRKLHERFKRSFEQRLLSHIDRMIQEYYPGYCSSDGKVVDRRLAQRIGVNPALISRLRAGDGNAMTWMSHFLALMNLCGVNWYECNFLPPQKAVLDGVTHLFPLAQEYVGTTQFASPDEEQVLVLYFASRLGLFSKYSRMDVRAANENLVGKDAAQLQKVIELVAAAECDAQDEPIPLVPSPKCVLPTQVTMVLVKHAKAWELLSDTFPFLGKPNRDGHSWGIF